MVRTDIVPDALGGALGNFDQFFAFFFAISDYALFKNRNNK